MIRANLLKGLDLAFHWSGRIPLGEGGMGRGQ